MRNAADSGDAFGISKPRFISGRWERSSWPAKSALGDRVMLNAAVFEIEQAGMSGKGASVAKHFEQSDEVDRQVLFDHVEIAEIVVDGDAGVVDEGIEGVDLIDCLLDLRNAGQVQSQGRHVFIVILLCAPSTRVNPLHARSKRLIDKRQTDATVGTGNPDCLVRNVHTVISGYESRMKSVFISNYRREPRAALVIEDSLDLPVPYIEPHDSPASTRRHGN
jgi:hypothetical protein